MVKLTCQLLNFKGSSKLLNLNKVTFHSGADPHPVAMHGPEPAAGLVARKAHRWMGLLATSY